MTTQPHHIATVLDHPGAADGQRGNSATNALDGLHRNQAAGLRNRPPLRCGFSPLDEVLTGGFRGGDFVLVGGKPGKGKTVAALQWARNMAKGGSRALFVSFEHDASSLLLRLLTLELAEAAAEEGCTDQLRLETLRGRLQVLVSTSEPIAGVLGSDPLLHKAEERVRAYGEQLMLIESSRAGCDVRTLDRMVGSQPDQSCVLFVDYLQKLPSSSQAATDAERVTYAFRRVLARPPAVEERKELLSLLEKQRQRLGEGWLNPNEIATGAGDLPKNLPPGVTPAQLAAYTVLSRVLLNLDETITKE